MFTVAFLGLFFLRTKVEARVAICAFVLSHVLSAIEMGVVGRSSFTVGMIAINHCIVWSPALIYLLSRIRHLPIKSAYGMWCLTITGMFMVSLFFDFRDAVIYILEM